jgi:hypothetical protein
MVANVLEKCYPHFHSAIEMEVKFLSETLVTTYKAAQCGKPEDQNPPTHLYSILISISA